MMSTKIKRMLRTGLIFSVVAALGCTCTLVYAEPSTGELEQKTSGLQGELNNLNSELSSLIMEIDVLATQVEEIAAEMQDTQKRMDEAQKKGEQQYEDMKLRIKYMYESGNTSFLELLCAAESMADFLNKSDFIKDVSEYDRNMLQELLATQNEIEAEGQELQEQQEELLSLQEQLMNKRNALESQIIVTSAELSQYQEQLARARAAEQLEAQRLAQLIAQMNNQQNGTGTSGGYGDYNSLLNAYAPDPNLNGTGQYLGSFKITHYCPCYYCSESWGSLTATGTACVPGRTIAVDPKVIPYGSTVIINGHKYIAEDCGGAIKGNRIDVYVPDHSLALALGVYYADVYLAN